MAILEEVCEKALVGIFMRENITIEYFLGGSRRFGYDDAKSDVDIFILIPPNKTLLQAETILRKEKFMRTSDYKGNYELGFIQFQDEQKLFHINVTDNPPLFSQLKKDHEEIEKFLSKKYGLVNYIKFLKKEFDIKGKYIFRLLREMI